MSAESKEYIAASDVETITIRSEIDDLKSIKSATKPPIDKSNKRPRKVTIKKQFSDGSRDIANIVIGAPIIKSKTVKAKKTPKAKDPKLSKTKIINFIKQD